MTVAAALLLPVTATAQEEPTSTPETGEIGNGTAKATAMVARIGPGVGNLELAMRAGLAVTQVTNNVAQSTGQTLDLGLIGTSLTAEGCSDALLTADQLPQSTNTDNREGHARVIEDESGQADFPVTVGHKDVEAGDDPVYSRSTTTFAGINLPGVLSIAGGQATALTEVLPGEGRQATATVNASVSVGPLTLSGLEWRAFHRTGVDPHAEGTFSLGSISGIPSAPLPLDQLGEVEKLLNDSPLMAALGLSIQFPKVERFLEPNDLVRVTPLRISLRDSPLGALVLGPIRVGTQEAQSTLFEALTEAICQAAAALLVGDIAVSVIAGTGFITLDIGGAEAMSSKFVVTNPFGEYPALPPAVSELPPSSTPSFSSPATPAQTTRTTVAPTTTQELAAPVTERISSGPMEKFCASVHPKGGSCAEGAGLALALVGILMTIGVAGYEVRKQWPGGGS